MRPVAPRVNVNVPTSSPLSVRRIVNVITLPDVDATHKAGRLSSVSSTRIGPPCSRTNVPATGKRRVGQPDRNVAVRAIEFHVGASVLHGQGDVVAAPEARRHQRGRRRRAAAGGDGGENERHPDGQPGGHEAMVIRRSRPVDALHWRTRGPDGTFARRRSIRVPVAPAAADALPRWRF